jgi:hypothetical protein
MVQLNLSAEEQKLLRQQLESMLSDLRMEIASTDLMDFREQLKQRKRVLQKTLEALAGEVPAG